MMLRPIVTKARLKSKALARRLKTRTRVCSLDKFYNRHWRGETPGAPFFAIRTQPSFFFDSKDSEKYQKALRNEFPESCRQIITRAEKAVAHIFDLLGSGEQRFDDKIDWHIDIKTGKHWKQKSFAKIRLVDLDDNSDVKMPWELSRLQFLTDLGRAYWLTREEVYLDEFKRVILDWEASNPVDIGVNWTCSMEIAIRAINIIWGLHFFGDKLDGDFIKKSLRLLYYHGLHIEKNLEIIADGANTNHLIADYLGLLYLGILFPQFDRAKSWKKLGIEGLEREIRTQVLPDGADYECSTSYHRLVLEMFLSAYILGRINSVAFSDTFRQRLRNMIQFSTLMTSPVGLVPLIGDNDDGFVVKLSTDDPRDHRPLINAGLTAYGEKIPCGMPMTEEQLWYLGLESFVTPHDNAVVDSHLFKESGYAVVRNKNFHFILNSAGVPSKSLGGHKHNDLLSFTLELDGFPYLIDPGTYCYSADYKLRNLSRSTEYHNTVTIDGQEQNRFFNRRLFYLSHDAVPKIGLWADSKDCATISASHDGYNRLNHAVIHKRIVRASPMTSSVLIFDEFTGKEGFSHSFDLAFVTSLQGMGRGNNCTAKIGNDGIHQLVIKGQEAGLINLEMRAIDYFPRYGVKEPATLIKYSYHSHLPFRVMTSITTGNRHILPSIQSRVDEGILKKSMEAAEVAI